MTKAAYFQCVGGASGDMILGALADAGLPREVLEDALDRMGIAGVSLSFERSRRGGLEGTFVRVELDADAERTRSFADFIETVESSALSDSVKSRSVAVFRRMERAESQVHGADAENLHLHELGTLDTLADVVGSVAGLEALGVERVYSSPFPMGSGVFRSAHGVLPVPSPAASALFTMANAPLVPAPGGAARTGEMVTPTGAAIITELAEFAMPRMEMSSVGYGLGARDPEAYPNALGVWIGETESAPQAGGLALLETNLDDAAGEILGYVHERLFEMGARDAWFTPIQMKKNRPAVMLSAIVNAADEKRAAKIIMRETGSLGVRARRITRHEAKRETRQVQTPLGTIAVKIGTLDGDIITSSPEYEDCRRVALETGLPLAEVYRVARAAFDGG